MLIRRPTIYTEIFRLASRGQDVILTCLVDSLSNHTAIMWTKDDVPLEITNRYRVSHTHRQGYLEGISELTVSDQSQIQSKYYVRADKGN